MFGDNDNYRTNVVDRDQDILEGSTFNNGVPVFVNKKTRVVAKGLHTAPEMTANATNIVGIGGATRKNAGVIMNPSDTPNRFVSDTQGKG